MATLFDTEVTLRHQVFQQPDQGRSTGLRRPLGLAFGYVAYNSGAASSDDWNLGRMKPLGVGSYVYTLQDVFVSMFFRSSAATAANAVKARAFADGFSAIYSAFPLYTDIGDQGLFNGTLIRPLEWAFHPCRAYNAFYQDATNGDMPIGATVTLRPDESSGHKSNHPIAIPETYDVKTSPLITAYTGELASFITAGGFQITMGASYLYWGPRDRLSAEAYAELPVRAA